MKREGLMMAGAVMVAGVAFLLGRGTAAKDADADIKELRDDKLAEDPNLSRNQATVEAAEDTAADALEVIRGAELSVGVPQATDAVKQAESEATQAERNALLYPTNPAVIQAARDAEALMVALRQELLQAKEEALLIAQHAMEKAVEAARVATAVYEKVYNDVKKWDEKKEQARLSIQDYNEQAQYWYLHNDWVLANRYYEYVREAKAQYDYYVSQRVLAIDELTLTIHPASSAIAKADNAIDAVESSIRDLRDVGLLLTLAARVDAIAQGARLKLAQFEQIVLTSVA